MDTWHRVFWNQRALYFDGFLTTVQVCTYGFLFAIALGLIICLMRMYVRPLRWLAIGLTEFFRDTPILVQLLWVAYVWPEIFGWPTDFFTSGWIALGLQSSGYLSETFRTGLEGIARGQREAGLTLGLSHARIFQRIVVPQAALIVAPAITNQFLVLVKSSTLVAVIAVPDLMFQALRQNNIWYEPVPIMTSVAVIYIVTIYLVSMLNKLITDRLRTKYGY